MREHNDRSTTVRNYGCVIILVSSQGIGLQMVKPYLNCSDKLEMYR